MIFKQIDKNTKPYVKQEEIIKTIKTHLPFPQKNMKKQQQMVFW